jgi:hypothetical protein
VRRELRAAPAPRRARAFLRGALLPEGFPHSVTPDYLPFQACAPQLPGERRTHCNCDIGGACVLAALFPQRQRSDTRCAQFWDSVQGLCSYVRGSFATAALLRGLGVGTAAASPLGATAAFLARDLTGHVGGVAFALMQGGALDASAKQFRYFADVANTIGYLLTLAAPALPARAFLPAVCAASLSHALTGVAGGATRAALTAHFALAHNAADVAAKEGSQETVVTLVGMLAGYVAVRLTAASVFAQWAVFLLLTALHLFANARAVRCVLGRSIHSLRRLLRVVITADAVAHHCLLPRGSALRLTSLNRERLALLAWHHAVSGGGVLTVAQAAAREPLLPRRPQWLRLRAAALPDVRIGAPLSALRRAPGAPPPAPPRGGAFVAARAADQRRTVCIALRRGATPADAAAAFAHVVRAAALCATPAAMDAAMDAAPACEWLEFASQLHAAGWDTSRLALQPDEGWRIEWP